MISVKVNQDKPIQLFHYSDEIKPLRKKKIHRVSHSGGPIIAWGLSTGSGGLKHIKWVMNRGGLQSHLLHICHLYVYISSEEHTCPFLSFFKCLGSWDVRNTTWVKNIGFRPSLSNQSTQKTLVYLFKMARRVLTSVPHKRSSNAFSLKEILQTLTNGKESVGKSV